MWQGSPKETNTAFIIWAPLNKVVIYADNTTLFFADKDTHAIESVLQDELHILNKWFTDNDLILTVRKQR